MVVRTNLFGYFGAILSLVVRGAYPLALFFKPQINVLPTPILFMNTNAVSYNIRRALICRYTTACCCRFVIFASWYYELGQLKTNTFSRGSSATALAN